ncbi:MAG: hypothetical protein H8E40_10065 [Chloroflexi bacterium]|nr:hypothetical protein [Chloroflexota bacterium]
MLQRQLIRLILAILGLAFLISCASATPPTDVTCTITSHGEGDKVGQYITLKGTASGITSKLSIYTFARAKIPAEPWWRSDKKAVILPGGEWTVDVVIGDEFTNPGTEFRVVVTVTSKEPPRQVGDLPLYVLSCASITLVRG